MHHLERHIQHTDCRSKGFPWCRAVLRQHEKCAQLHLMPKTLLVNLSQDYSMARPTHNLHREC